MMIFPDMKGFMEIEALAGSCLPRSLFHWETDI